MGMLFVGEEGGPIAPIATLASRLNSIFIPAGDAETREEPAKRSRSSTRNGKTEVPKGDEILTAVPSVKIPGHTGYLTFATFFGRQVEAEQSESVQMEGVADSVET